jgi:hypothetical protein
MRQECLALISGHGTLPQASNSPRASPCHRILILFRSVNLADALQHKIWWITFTVWKSRDISVGIALGYGLKDRGSRVRFPAGAGNFSLHHCVQNGSGAHPASCPMGTGVLSLGVKRSGREADHSYPSSTEVKKMSGAIPPLPQYAFMAWCSVKAWG